MTKLISIDPENFAPDGVPLFLGDPNSKPQPTFPEYPWTFFLSAMGLISEKYPHLSPHPDDYQLRQFIECSTILDQEEFEQLFIKWTENDYFWGPSPGTAWASLIQYLRPPKKMALFKIQCPIDENEGPTKKKNHQVNPGREITRQPIYKHGPKQATSREKQKKPYLRLAQTVRSYILEHQPHPHCIKLFDKVLLHCWNKQSKRGRKVYPYGQAYAAKQLEWGKRKLESRWQWLKKQGIFNKAWNENPKLHHHSGWYVCTSIKQVAYFRDPEKRRRRS